MLYYFCFLADSEEEADDMTRHMRQLFKTLDVKVTHAWGTLVRRVYELELPNVSVQNQLDALTIAQTSFTPIRPDKEIMFLKRSVSHRRKEKELKMQPGIVHWAWLHNCIAYQEDEWIGESFHLWLRVRYMLTKDEFIRTWCGAIFNTYVTAHSRGYLYDSVDLEELPYSAVESLKAKFTKLTGNKEFKVAEV